jgi:hypothetical protein
MRARICFFFILFFLTTPVIAQSPGFRFGPRIAMGSARFTGIEGMTDGFAAQVQFVASKQLTPWFGIQLCPMIAMYEAQRRMEMTDGTTATGKRRVFFYRDKYQVYTVEFPLLAKFSKGFGNTFVNVFTGPSFSCPMGGLHTKIFEDEYYNSTLGYSGHELTHLRENVYSGVFGIGVEYCAGRSTFGLDFRITHAFTNFGSIEGESFSARSATIGFTWLHF